MSCLWWWSITWVCPLTLLWGKPGGFSFTHSKRSKELDFGYLCSQFENIRIHDKYPWIGVWKGNERLRFIYILKYLYSFPPNYFRLGKVMRAPNKTFALGPRKRISASSIQNREVKRSTNPEIFPFLRLVNRPRPQQCRDMPTSISFQETLCLHVILR